MIACQRSCLVAHQSPPLARYSGGFRGPSMTCTCPGRDGRGLSPQRPGEAAPRCLWQATWAPHVVGSAAATGAAQPALDVSRGETPGGHPPAVLGSARVSPENQESLMLTAPVSGFHDCMAAPRGGQRLNARKKSPRWFCVWRSRCSYPLSSARRAPGVAVLRRSWPESTLRLPNWRSGWLARRLP